MATRCMPETNKYIAMLVLVTWRERAREPTAYYFYYSRRGRFGSGNGDCECHSRLKRNASEPLRPWLEKTTRAGIESTQAAQENKKLSHERKLRGGRGATS